MKNTQDTNYKLDISFGKKHLSAEFDSRMFDQIEEFRTVYEMMCQDFVSERETVIAVVSAFVASGVADPEISYNGIDCPVPVQCVALMLHFNHYEFPSFEHVMKIDLLDVCDEFGISPNLIIENVYDNMLSTTERFNLDKLFNDQKMEQHSVEDLPDVIKDQIKALRDSKQSGNGAFVIEDGEVRSISKEEFEEMNGVGSYEKMMGQILDKVQEVQSNESGKPQNPKHLH